jgi:signal transduction histidine kinase
MSDRQSTRFAPAERIDPQQIAREAPAVQAALELQPLLDAIPNVLVVLNRFRQVIYSNQALLDMLEIGDPSQIYGLRPGEVLDCDHAFEEAGGCGTSEACSTCGAAQAILMGLGGQAAVRECRLTTRAGAALDLRVWAKPLIVKGQVCTIFAIADISDEKRRNILERIFLHDIHNSAALVISYTDLIQRGDNFTDQELDGMLTQLRLVAAHMIRDIATQRIITAAENSTLTLSLGQVDPQQVLVDTRNEYSQYVNNYNLNVMVEPQPQRIEFISDRSLVERVIGNMLKNALEASRSGDTVTLRVAADAEYVTFEVHNPTFMPRKVQLQVFQRSYSTKGEGRGLGTYSIKLLSENYLQGKVWFESSKDRGTRFFARYPLQISSS